MLQDVSKCTKKLLELDTNDSRHMYVRSIVAWHNFFVASGNVICVIRANQSGSIKPDVTGLVQQCNT
jgi:hypothetical protein